MDPATWGHAWAIEARAMIGSLIILGMVILCISIGHPWVALLIVMIDRLFDYMQSKGRGQ